MQYAHARVCSVYRQLEEKGVKLEGEADVSLLVEAHEIELMTELARYPEVLLRAARDYAPHQLAYYLRDLANAFHSLKKDGFILSDDYDCKYYKLRNNVANSFNNFFIKNKNEIKIIYIYRQILIQKI